MLPKTCPLESGHGSLGGRSTAAASVLLVLSAVISAQSNETDAAQFFDDRIEPILSKRCLSCHNQELKGGGISFVDRESLLKGGSRGPSIVPGKPDESVLIHAVRQKGELKMPPGAKLSSQDIETLTEWVARGAAWGTKLRGPDGAKSDP